MTLAFVVPGEPVGKQRARTFLRKRTDGTPFVTTMTPPKTAAYELAVKLVARAAVAGARWTFTPKDRFAIVLRVFRTHLDAGADLDNVIKSVADALNGIAFVDDRHVRGIAATMRRDRVRPRVEVEVRRLPPTRSR